MMNKIIINGLITCILVNIAIPCPNIIRKIRLKQTVINNATKSSFNLSETWILGWSDPINKCVVNLEIKIVEISPIKEFSEGSNNKITGKE